MHTTESLKALTLGDLQKLYVEATGKPTRCPNKGWLVKQILAAGEASTTTADEAGETGDTGVEATETNEAAEITAAEAGTATEAGTTADGADCTGHEADAPPAADPTDPWAGATDIEARIAVVRRASTIAQLDALAAAGKRPQSAVRAEMAKQQDALERVAETTDRKDLAALAAGKQAHTRPGVGEAIRAALAVLGDETTGTDRPLASMSVEELQGEYTRVVGRSTSSDHRGYLMWKIREALKGRVTVGAIDRVQRDPEVEQKVLPIRMEETVVEAMDAAWKRLGYKTRMAFIRDALAGLLDAKGEAEAAGAVRGAV